MTDTATGVTQLTHQVNDMLREVDMHIDQHRDGLIFGLIPETENYGIYNDSLLFLNKHSTDPTRRLVTTYMTLREYTETEAEKYGWTLPYTQDPAFVPRIKYGPLAQIATGRVLNLAQVKQNLQQLRKIIWETVRTNLKFTPHFDTITTYFALQMISSSPDTDWHIQPLSLNQYLQPYLVGGVHAPLIFAALASPKLGTRRYSGQDLGDTVSRLTGVRRTDHRREPEIQAPRFSASEAQTWDTLHLQLAFDLLRIDFFDGT